jgi:hypothetical protein
MEPQLLHHRMGHDRQIYEFNPKKEENKSLSAPNPDFANSITIVL